MRLVLLRPVDLILVAVLIGVIAWTFKVKHDSQVALERVAELERLIEAERIEIDLLKSDWSLLTNPARLQELVERYNSELALEPVDPEQIGSEGDLPGYRIDMGRQRSPIFDNRVEADKSIVTGGTTKENTGADE